VEQRQNGNPEGINHREHREHRGRMERDALSGAVIGCAIEVHRALGPGLLESTYQQCLAQELRLAGLGFRLECPMPVVYKGINLDCGYRIDCLVDDRLILELKAVDQVSGIHKAQLLTYMKLSQIEIGLLINFNVKKLVDGIERFRL
jgi:GxxExxY protein